MRRIFSASGGSSGEWMKFAIVDTTGFGIERFLDTARGAFRSKVDLWGARFRIASAVMLSRANIPFMLSPSNVIFNKVR